MTRLSTVPWKATTLITALALCLNAACFPLPLHAEEATASGTTEMMLSQAEDATSEDYGSTASPTALAKTSDTSTYIPAAAAFAGAIGIALSLKNLHRRNKKLGE